MAPTALFPRRGQLRNKIPQVNFRQAEAAPVRVRR
jgi:hypothetical protein